MIGQIGLGGFTVGPAVGLGLLILMVPLMFGCMFGALAIISAAERGNRLGPIVLACVAISSTVVVLLVVPGAFRGFDIATIVALTPLLLGSWVIFEVATRSPTAIVAKADQFSLRSLLNIVFCAAIAIGIMVVIDEKSRSEERDFIILGLLTKAKMVINTPVTMDGNSNGSEMFGVGPDAAIELCNKAIALAPDNGEAYDLRATAYEQMGDTQRAWIDRWQAEKLGY